MFEKAMFEAEYSADGVRHTVVMPFQALVNSEAVGFNLSHSNDGKRESIKVSVIPRAEIKIHRLELVAEYEFHQDEKIFLNGYQSWTDSAEHGLQDRQKGIPLLGRIVNPYFQLRKYGDYDFIRQPSAPGEFHGFSYGYIKKQGSNQITLLGSLNEQNAFTVIRFTAAAKEIRVSMECNNLATDKPVTALQLLCVTDEENKAFDQWFSAMELPAVKTPEITGWTSWYDHYENISSDIINQNLEAFTNTNLPIEIFQIDDGFQTATGDWLSIDKAKFPEGLAPVVDRIHKSGYKAGLWLAPFSAQKNSELAKQHPEWLLRDGKGKPVQAGINWGGFYALDIYNQEFRDHLAEVFNTVLNEWGFDMVKLDFLYGACLAPETQGRTRGAVMHDGMKLLRELTGSKLILGCGVPLASAFGLVDYCRIGCDVSLDWDDGFRGSQIHRERPSTLNSLANAIGRRHLDGRAFRNDPDVFILRDRNTKLSGAEKETLFRINAVTGALVFTSDNVAEYSDTRKKMFESLKAKKKIESVESDSGTYTISYTEGGKEHILFANLSDKTIFYSGLEVPAHSSVIL